MMGCKGTLAFVDEWLMSDAVKRRVAIPSGGMISVGDYSRDCHYRESESERERTEGLVESFVKERRARAKVLALAKAKAERKTREKAERDANAWGQRSPSVLRIKLRDAFFAERIAKRRRSA